MKGLQPLPPIGTSLICLFPASLYSITPIFTLSSVSGESLDLLKVFLNILPPLTNSKEQEELMQQLTEFQVIGHLDRQSARELGGTNPEPRVCFEVLELPALDRIFFGFRWMKSTRYQRWAQLLEGHFPGELPFLLVIYPTQPSYTQGPENIIAHRPRWQ